ncbi:MAG: M42 family metallopeptidase [Eubacteriales bacterium]
MSNYETCTHIELLRTLSLAFGPSGCEGEVAELIREFVTPYADEVTSDRLGTVIAVYRRADVRPASLDEEPKTDCGKPEIDRLMFAAHMDEVGFMIRSIDGDGCLKIAALSGRDPKTLAGRNVTVGNETKHCSGYFGVKPTHLGGVGNFDSLYIDIGAKNKEDAEKMVSPGDFGTYRSDFVRFGNGFIKGKALDDRFGCTVLCLLLRRLRENKVKLPYDVYFCFTVREEIGASGAQTAANKIQPDIGIVIEATAVDGTRGEDRYGSVAKQGCGGCVSFMDRSTIYDREVYDFILRVAEKHNIPAQPKCYVSGGNDAGYIHKAGVGAKCAAISAPARYIHTASNVIAEADLEYVTDLAYAVMLEMQ